MYELTEEEKKVWEYLQKKPATKKKLADKFNISISTISRKLKNIDLAGKPLIKERVGNQNVMLYSCPSSIDDVVQSSNYEPPQPSYARPIEVNTKSKDYFKLGFANTIFAGGKTNKKLFKNFLKYSKADDVDAVVLTGNLLWMDLTKFSKYKPDRAKNSDIEIDPSMVHYPKTVIDGGEDPTKLIEENKPIYLTFKERLDLIVERSLKPLFLEDNKPILDKPIYIIFGEMEEELSRQQANEAIRREKAKKAEGVRANLSELKLELKIIRKEVKQFEKEMEKEEPSETELKKLVNKYKEDKTKEEKLLQQIADYQDQLSRVLMTNIDDKYIDTASNAIKGYIIDKIETAIPNSKVISTGEGYLKVNDKIVKVIYNANKLSDIASDNLMDKLVETTRVNLSQNIEAPTVVVSGGLSATYTYNPIPYIDEEGEKTVSLIQLPTCLNEGSLEEILRAKVRAGGSNMAKLATKSSFNSGALILEYVNGIQKRKFLRSNYLTNDEAFKNENEIKNYKIFYEANFSDQHHGSKYVSIIETRDNIKYTFEISQQLLNDIKAPITKINSLGDELQEKNYNTEVENHSEYLYPKQVEEKIREIYTKYKGEKRDTEMKKLIKKNTIRAGIIPPQKQKFDFLDIINTKWIKKVLENARKIGLEGPVLNIINGNHSVHTFEGLVNLTEDIARELRFKTGATEKEIIAPILGKSGVYAGIFGLKNHYLWGEYCRHKQGGSKNSKDSTRRMRKSFEERGQDYPQLKGKHVTNRAAHDHRGGQSASKNVIHEKSYCYMDRNEYGENLDMGSPTRGFKMLGYPIDGPSTGPLIAIEFPLEYLKKWVNEKPGVDVKRLFENSVIEVGPKYKKK